MTRDEIRFHFLRNALMHTARRRVLEGWARFFNFVVIVLGTAAAADLVVDTGISQSMLGVAVAAAGAAQLVFDFAGKARTHEFLQRRYYEQLADIEAQPGLSAKAMAVFEGRIALLAAEEPPTYRAVDTLAYNEALDAIHGASCADQRLVLPWWHLPLVHLAHFNGWNYRSVEERAAARAARRTK